MIGKLIAAILGLSFGTFVALFGRLPAFRQTPIGLLHRLLCFKLPFLAGSLDDYVTGGLIRPFLYRAANYVSYANHPLVLTFYLAVLFSSQALFIPAVLPRISHDHIVPIALSSIIPYLLTYKAVCSQSSVITCQNHESELRRYPYDFVLYQPGQTCRTCHFTKPARSKHCSVCNVCVAKHDHHCIWLMNCLGRGNYVYFLGLIGSLGVLLSYGVFLAHRVLILTLQKDFETKAPLREEAALWGNNLTWTEYFDAWSWAVSNEPRIGAVGLLALCIAPLAWGLFFYHLYLIWAGMTTNETGKWADWRDDAHEGLVVKKRKAFFQPATGIDGSEMEAAVRWRYRRVPDGASSEQDWVGKRMANGWTKVQSLNEMDNIYDLGFWKNLRNVWDRI